MRPIFNAAALAAFAATLFAGATPAAAQATLSADRADWSAAIPKIADVDLGNFGEFRIGNGATAITFQHVVFSEAAGPSVLAYIDVMPGYGNTSTVITSQQGRLENILITLPVPTYAFAVNVGTFGGTATNFQLSDGEAFTLPTTGFELYGTPDFFGVTSTKAFTSVLVTSTDEVLQVSDVAYGVPEPASWALMILGFGAAGAALRRRRGALRSA